MDDGQGGDMGDDMGDDPYYNEYDVGDGSY
jgi:hypothetical protein